MNRLDQALAETISHLRAAQLPVRSWTATVADRWGVPVRYDCRAVDSDQARTVIADLAGCELDRVVNLARTCAIFAAVEVGDPR